MQISEEVINWVILPLLIFIARMSDVTLGTLRNIFISRGFKKIVPIVGFFEVLIWLIAMKQVMSRADNFVCYFAWASANRTRRLVSPSAFIPNTWALRLTVFSITFSLCAVSIAMALFVLPSQSASMIKRSNGDNLREATVISLTTFSPL